MARTRTLQDLVADVRWLADIENATARHTDKKIVRALNQSVQAFRLMISEAGDPYYYSEEVSTFNNGTSEFTPAAADIVAVLGLDILVGGELQELFPYQFSERNRYASDSTGTPTFYRYQGVKIALMPPADDQYTYRLTYLPAAADMTATYDAYDMITASTSSFDGIAGWEDWVVYDTAMRVSSRDAGVNDNFEILQAELARIQARITPQAKKRTRQGPVRRVDTRGRRMQVEAANRWKAP